MKKEAWTKYADAEVLARVRVRLIEPEEKSRWDDLICAHHYLGNANLVGRQLRYVAELDGQWVALLSWNAAAYHLKAREAWIGWTTLQQQARRKFVVQNSRFLLLVDRGKHPNLASRVLSLCMRRLSADWEEAFGHPVLVAESFVDPERFSGSCYRAAGWEPAGKTQGFRRHRRDFYQADSHPKELWLCALHRKARRWLRAEQMPERLAKHEDRVWHCEYSMRECRSLWDRLNDLPDVRRTNGRRHRLASTLTICALATLCGARGTRAIADFAQYLTQRQLRLLRAYYNPRACRYEPPSEPTIRRMLKRVAADEFDAVVKAWMEEHDPRRLGRLAIDGKTVRGSRQANGKPVHLLAAVAPDSLRLVAQTAVAEKSNEITALRPLLEEVALDGVIVTADAMHAQQATARFIQQEKGGEYLFYLKGNQPTLAGQAQALLSSAFPPSAPSTSADDREKSRTP